MLRAAGLAIGGSALPNSLWDRIAYSGIWIGAVFEAIWYYSAVVPSVTEHVAPFFTERWWALIPLALLTLSGAITLWRAIVARPASPPNGGRIRQSSPARAGRS